MSSNLVSSLVCVFFYSQNERKPETKLQENVFLITRPQPISKLEFWHFTWKFRSDRWSRSRQFPETSMGNSEVLALFDGEWTSEFPWADSAVLELVVCWLQAYKPEINSQPSWARYTVFGIRRKIARHFRLTGTS